MTRYSQNAGAAIAASLIVVAAMVPFANASAAHASPLVAMLALA